MITIAQNKILIDGVETNNAELIGLCLLDFCETIKGQIIIYSESDDRQGIERTGTIADNERD